MNQPEFVAEVSSNHHQDLARCLEFVDRAAQIGCSTVKFQLFRVEKLFAPEILKISLRHRARKQWEIPLSFIPAIRDRCRQKGIRLSCTPFYLEAVAELLPYVDVYKIASYELLWTDLLTACARSGKPVVISTGMATVSEIRQAVDTLAEAGCRDLTILHCVSGYPAPVSDCNLAAIGTLQKEFATTRGTEIGGEIGSDEPRPNIPKSLRPERAKMRVRVGWSDHSLRPAVLYRAIHAWQAEVIEFHLDLDGTGEEFPLGHCWLPEQIAAVIEQVREGFRADGSGVKEPASSELPDRNWRRDPRDGLRPLGEFRQKWLSSLQAENLCRS